VLTWAESLALPGQTPVQTVQSTRTAASG